MMTMEGSWFWKRRARSFTFRQKFFSGVIECRLAYIFILNSLQEEISKVEILNPFSTDRSTLFCSFIKSLRYSKGPGLWKFNDSLLSNNDFVEEMKFFIHNTKRLSEQNIYFSNQSKWEFLKYEMLKKCVSFKVLKMCKIYKF